MTRFFLVACLAGCAHTILDSAPCALPADQPAYLAGVRGFVAQELTKSGLSGELSPSLAEIFTPAHVEGLRRAAAEGRCRRVHYRSDGLRVVGFILQPAGAQPRSLPAILYARGGNREMAKNDFESLTLLQALADQGFVVAATQYRGVDGGEGREQFGGADVHDLMALVGLVRGLSAVDGKRIYLYGHSRGAMEAYEALRDGIDVRAAAVSGGPVDLDALLRARPEMEKVTSALIPEWSAQRARAIEHRSALRWAERIRVPLLILHARQDWRVPLAQAQAMDAQLTQLGREHALRIIDGDAHQLFLHRRELIEALVSWFRSH
jgi:dipeptidyl aminopeptidase/acylaminoacyl peptidase